MHALSSCSKPLLLCLPWNVFSAFKDTLPFHTWTGPKPLFLPHFTSFYWTSTVSRPDIGAVKINKSYLMGEPILTHRLTHRCKDDGCFQAVCMQDFGKLQKWDRGIDLSRGNQSGRWYWEINSFLFPSITLASLTERPNVASYLQKA